eukprot:symbB.v1.2.017243.t1/scaffold1344.1/size124249/6
MERPEGVKDPRGVVLIIDLDGLSVRHLSPRLVSVFRAVSEADEAHYPDTVAHIFVVNAPWIFQAVFAMIRPFLNEDTLTKVHFSNKVPINIIHYLGKECLPCELHGSRLGVFPYDLTAVPSDHPKQISRMEPYDREPPSAEKIVKGEPDAGMSAMMGAGGQFGAPGAGPRGPGPNPQQARRPPMDMMRGPNKLGPEMGGNQPGPGQIRQPPMPPQAPQQMQAQPRPMQGNMQPRDDEARANYEQHQRLMLMQAVMDRETAERQKGGPPGPPGAGPPGPPGPPGPQSQMPAMPKQPPQPPAPKQQRKQPEISPGSTAPEGSRGAIWVVMKSQHFSHVIVRATQEVTSPELRRVLPGEAVTQRDLTETLPNGLVRMPVEPDGWVTVHARHINGPTFLAEASRHEPQQQRPNRGREAMAQPPPPPAEKKAPDYVRNAYSKETLLLARDHLINRGLQVPVEMKGLRSLMVPNMGDRKAGREHRKHRDQDRTAQAQDLEDDDEGREAEPPLPMPSREAPREVERPPPAVNNLDMTVRPKPAKVPKEDESPRGEEKKPNCPTQ